MKKYSIYKATDVIWVKILPEMWDELRVKYFSVFRNGYSFKGTDFFDDEKYPVIRIGDIQDGKVNLTDAKKVSKDVFEKAQNFINRRGDILLALTGATIGKSAIYDTDDISLLNQRVAALRPNKKANIDYLKYLIEAPEFKTLIDFECYGGAQENIGKGQITSAKFPIPSLPEQHAIVSFLDYKTGQIDSFIANRQKQIELLKEQKAGIINKAVTKGINPNAKMKDSGIEWIGEVPEHWSVTKLKFVSKIFGRIGFRGYTINDLVEKGEGAITISPSNMKANEMNFDSCTYISWYKYEESPEIKIFNGDVLFVKTGSTYGKVSMVENLQEPATINPQILVFKKIKTNPMFFYHQLRSKLIQAHVKTSVIGGTIPTISQEKIGNYYFLLPSKVEQEQIIKHITNETGTIDTIISKYQKQIDLMQEYRTSLISQAVTGKIDVRDWQPKNVVAV